MGFIWDIAGDMVGIETRSESIYLRCPRNGHIIAYEHTDESEDPTLEVTYVWLGELLDVLEENPEILIKIRQGQKEAKDKEDSKEKAIADLEAALESMAKEYSGHVFELLAQGPRAELARLRGENE